MFFQVVLLGIITLLLFANRKNRGRKNYPKGPWRLPVIGNLHQLAGEFPQKDLLAMSKTYGPIFSLKMGTYETVVLNDIKLMREAFAHPAIAGRPAWPQFVGRTNGERKGLTVVEGKDYVEQRRFALKTMKDRGLGKAIMEGLITEEIVDLMSRIKLDNGSPIDTTDLFTTATVNTVMVILFGKRMDQNDPLFKLNIHYLNDLTPDKKSVKALMVVFPWMIKISKKYSGYEDTMKGFKFIEDYIRSIIAEHDESRIPNEPRDYIDSYFDEIEKTKDVNSSFYKEKGMETMVWMAFDLFSGATETTRLTIAWSCVAFAKSKECQDKFRAEIRKTSGNNPPSLLDRPNMPYVEAFINEIARYSSLLYFGVPRRTTEEVQLAGYTIPVGVQILGNFYAAHHDQKTWGDPEIFRPERFINADGGVSKPEYFHAFGSGKRVCPGETFARDSLFLFLTHLISTFEILPDPTNPEPPHFRSYNTTFTCCPSYKTVCFKKLKA